VIVPERQTIHDFEDVDGYDPLAKGDITTLEMTQAQKQAAKKREQTKVIGFAPPEQPCP
jgi:hypothetical protein